MFTVDMLTAALLTMLAAKGLVSAYRSFRDRGLQLIDDEESYQGIR